MGNRSILIVVTALVVVVLSSIQNNSYTLSGQEDGLSTSDIPIFKSINGSITSERVIDVSPTNPRTEVSFIEYAIMNNVGNVSNTGTYVEDIISSDIIRLTGQGFMTSLESNDKVGWNAYDLGTRHDNGSFIFKGIIFFHILPPEDEDNEFMFLDNQVGVFKSVVNDTGSTRELWIWN